MDKQTSGCNSPHDWLTCLAMDLAVWLLCGAKNGISGCHLAIFGVDISFACHFVAPIHPLLFTPIRVLVVLATPVKNYLKKLAIQLAIHSTVGA